MATAMGGRYPAAGITLGPAMTLRFIVVRDLAGPRPIPEP
jgi:hypothetical protein